MNSAAELLTAFSRHLPRIAEEGSDREEISETELVQRLVASTGTGLEHARATLGIVRRLLQALSVLDERLLTGGEWAFVSFPAFLLARSVLGGLGDPGFRLLESGYWDANDFRIERQRGLIKYSEELRAALPAGLVPIRRVWVSWAWIAMDEKFLMVRRDDPALHRDGSRGQFVFPGGRVSSADLPALEYSTTSARLDFFDPYCEVDAIHSRSAFSQAMHRELREELEIPANGFESQRPECPVIQHKAMEGAKSAFSATEYHLQPFKVELNNAGKTALLRCLASRSERFAWFTTEELVATVNAAGDRAFVDALHENGQKLDPKLYTVHLGMVDPIQDPIDIPGAPGEPFSIGITGREKKVHVDLGPEETNTLTWLAAVRRGESVSELAAGVSIAHGSGWVLVDDDAALTQLKSLAAKLKSSGLLLLDFHEHAVRLNAVTPYFSTSLMAMEIHDESRGKSYRLTLARRKLQSPLGIASAREATTTLSETLGNTVYSLAHNDSRPASENLETWKRIQRQSETRSYLDSMGVRLLVRQVDGVPELAIGQR